MLRILRVRGQFHCSQKPSACTEYLTSSPPSKIGEDSYEAWFGFNQSTFGGFLFHRSALLRRISAGFTSGLGLATKERYTKTCALYPRSQERSLTAHLVNTARRGLFTRWAVKPRRFLGRG